MTSETGLNRITTLTTCEGSICNLLCHPKNGMLIVITSKGILYHQQLAPPNGATAREITKMKLAVNFTGRPSITWAGQSVLAMALGESVIRLWDVERADNYTLEPNVSECETSEKAVKAIKVAYSYRHQILACGLNNGMVAFWQYGTELTGKNNLHRTTEFTEASEEDPNENWPIGVQSPDRNEVERGPEYNWHPQPTAILTYRTEDEFSAGLPETGRHVYVLSWDGDDDRLAIAVSARHAQDSSVFNHGLNMKCAAYLLERQPLCGGFGGSGCAVVQTGPRSLAMLTTVQPGKTGTAVKSDAEPVTESLNPLSIPTNTNLPASFIVTSTALRPGMGNRKITSLQDENHPVPLIREHEAQVEDQIRALYCTPEYLSYWNGNRISTFKHATGDCIVHFGDIWFLVNLRINETLMIILTLTELCVHISASFPCEFRLVGMHDQNLFTVEPFKLQVRSLQCRAVTEQIKPNQETLMTASASLREIRIAHVAINNRGDAISFSVEIVADGSVCDARWPKITSTRDDPIVNSKTRPPLVRDQGPKPIAENRFKSTNKLWIPDTRIYIYHIEKDKMQYFDCCELTRQTTLIGGLLDSRECGGRWPRKHYWDQYESRLLVMEAAGLPKEHPLIKRGTRSGPERFDKHPLQSDSPENPNSMIEEDLRLQLHSTSPSSNLTRVQSRQSSKITDFIPPIKPHCFTKLSTLIVSVFTGAEQIKPVVQEQFPMAIQYSALLGIEVPYYYFSVRCDLVYRLVTEQGQRRRDMVNASGRRLVGDENGALNGTVHDLIDNVTDKTASSADKLIEKRSIESDAIVNPTQSDSTGSERRGHTGLKIHYIHRRIMRDFLDLEWTDANTREAMLAFSYYLTMGEMDAAFKAMKLIKSPAVWQNMARMCVSTCRLDVARVCLGKMGDAMAAMMVREARQREPEPEAQAGELALQLGMPDEAERLFTQCCRWDLVIRLYQSLGQWEKALQVAATHNRISLRATHYAYAKELETSGKIKEAMEHYILSETHRFEVPRMLKSSPILLETFVNQQQDKTIHRWWAQTLESEGRLDEARNYYFQAKEYLSLVRVLCCLGKEGEAEALCNETGDPAACYHLARQMEACGNVDQAIRLFTRAKAYSSAEHNRNDHLYSLAQLGRPEDMLEAAIHLESCPSHAHKAVLLFHKAGQIGRSVELAFKTRQFAALQAVAGSLDDRIDPALLKQCAEFFTQNNQFDRAVDVLAAGKQYWDALKLCGEYNVPINEELVEKLTPPLPGEAESGTNIKRGSEPMSDAERTSILIELGELCLAQGQYHLACKKFTQAGSRLAAMKALLRSGDTEKIVFFANVSKQKEIYVMAANYLQTLDEWRTNVDTMRTIVNFYTRGKAPESLASFYEACAHAEVEEFGSYEKATGALTEAYKVLLKAISSDGAGETNELRLQKRLAQIKNKATMCKEFAETQLLFSVNPMEAMRNCQTLLEHTEPGDILRPGDIYAAMIREFVAKEKYQAALACMEEMRERLQITNQSIARYLDRKTLDNLHDALNLSPAAMTGSADGPKSDVDMVESPGFDDPILEASLSDASDEDN
ncbi:unnamed protein product [Echinostoma caproni]|uniref:WD_REPEATS_REGION domain-containing protein n=1 Tax=Echinostoma caproni TaxID=27848 RepID=A0A183ABZ6_9TREM|nr:unnamed protein product [Echinostoma caproni]